ncbi:MAG: hypothetical protein M1168_01785 [Candidatus Marsarchaeota archaeon]|nr:hypothetical protein [Candidatus Marsarchaeota archaeon]MCL5094692.1 hypothetical protein [Candidatus Marsarchaeota archaeon]
MNRGNKNKNLKLQSSLELLITVGFGLLILIPIVIIGFIEMASSSSILSTSAAQQVTDNLATVSAQIGVEGPGARQLVLIQIPQNVRNISIGSNSIPSHLIAITVSTSGGNSSIISYSLVNVSGNLTKDILPGQYLVNVSNMAVCPSDASVSCVYIAPT